MIVSLPLSLYYFERQIHWRSQRDRDPTENTDENGGIFDQAKKPKNDFGLSDELAKLLEDAAGSGGSSGSGTQTGSSDGSGSQEDIFNPNKWGVGDSQGGFEEIQDSQGNQTF